MPLSSDSASSSVFLGLSRRPVSVILIVPYYWRESGGSIGGRVSDVVVCFVSW